MTMTYNNLGPRGRLALVLTFLLIAAPVACDDPFALDASEETETDTLKAFALTGTPQSLPVAYNAVGGQLARVEPSMSFDVAFDLTSDGKIRVIPARLISATKQTQGLEIGTHQVGLLASSQRFEEITRAPDRGFLRDSLVVASVGQTVLLELQPDICTITLSPVRYAKIVVDSVRAATREIFFRGVRNPNCGFRSFLPGVPKN